MGPLIRTLVTPADRLRSRLWRQVSRTKPGRVMASRRDARLGALAAGALLTSLLTTVVAPVWALLLAPVFLGVPHALSDLRYLVLDRQRPLGRAVLVALAVPLAAVVVLRIAGGLSGTDLSTLEVGCGLACVAAGVILSRGAALDRLAALAGVGLLALAMLPHSRDSISWLGQMHNAIALAIWVAWMGEAPADPVSGPRFPWRTAVRFGVPALYAIACLAILGGVLDPLFRATHAWRPAAGLSLDDLAFSIAPGASEEMGTRLVALFAFGQAMHYAVWLRLIPQTRAKGRAPASFRQGVTAFRADFGPRGSVVAVLSCLAVPAVAIVSPVMARDGYLTLVAFHAWLEIAVLTHRWTSRSQAHRSAVPVTAA